MKKFRLGSRSLTFFAILFVGAMIGTSFIGAVPSEAATSTIAYTVYKDSSGYTCAKNAATGVVDIRSTTSYLVIQKAVDKSSGKSVLIKAGTYDISRTIYTGSTSITGEGNGTVLKATTAVRGAVIMVTNNYYKADGTKASTARPNGVTISNLAIDGNRAVRTSGTLEGIGFINALYCNIYRVYSHDIIGGQGFYMSNSQYCNIKNSWVYNIGSSAYANYGSGIAFGEASSTKVASSNIVIENCLISKCSMSSIDLEPANHVTIKNCVFREAMTWNGAPTPVITVYAIYGYAANDYVTITGCNAYGAFGEFFIMTPSNYCVVSNNVITYTAGLKVALYASNSHDNKIIGNVIKTVSKNGIQMVNCRNFLVEGNTVTDSTLSKSDYGIRFYESSGTSANNIIKKNTVTGFRYAITSNTGSDYATIQYNVVKSSYCGLFLSGTHNVKTSNTLNGAYDWVSA